MVNNTEVGNKIREIRMSKGDTLEEFGIRIARTLEISSEKAPSKSNVSRWEAGSSLPNKKRIKAIADIGQISVDDLLYGDLNTQVPVDDELINKFESYLERKNDFFKQEFKLLAPAIKSGILTFGLGFKNEREAAIDERVRHNKNIEKLRKFGFKYILDNYHNYTYEKFLINYPNSEPDDFKKYKNNAWIIFKEELDMFWESSEFPEQNHNWIIKNFTDQIADELNKINEIATDDIKRDYYINEVVQPYLDNAAKEFKEYLKKYVDN